MRAIHRLALLAMLGLASVTLKATDGCSMASLWFSGADQFWCQTSGDWDNWFHPRGAWIALTASVNQNFCGDWLSQLNDFCSTNGLGIVIELVCDDYTYGYYEGECCTDREYCPV
jgi:hypothetical protein